jgi:hypothetical protein
MRGTAEERLAKRQAAREQIASRNGKRKIRQWVAAPRKTPSRVEKHLIGVIGELLKQPGERVSVGKNLLMAVRCVMQTRIEKQGVDSDKKVDTI